MTTDYILTARIPDSTTYRELRAATGLSGKSEAAAARGLPNSQHAVIIEHQGEVVGMGRIIGDGGTAFQITDIAVLPAHQGRGLGKLIVGALVDWLKANAPPTAYVSLIADGEAHKLYAQFGFAPTAPASIGMYLRIT